MVKTLLASFGKKRCFGKQGLSKIQKAGFTNFWKAFLLPFPFSKLLVTFEDSYRFYHICYCFYRFQWLTTLHLISYLHNYFNIDVCLSPSPSHFRVSCNHIKICILGGPQTPRDHKAGWSWATYIKILDGQNHATYIKTQFSASSPPQCWSKAIVCVNILRMYPLGRYFPV